MANETIRTEIRGLREAQKRMEGAIKDIGGAPILDWMRKATLLVQRDAKKLAPVDTGRLRASITPEVRTAFHTIEGVVGSNVVYAPYMELGTRPHFPPPGALEVWARRHGTSAYLVARAIAQRGLAGRHYLEGALKQNEDRIFKLLGQTVAQIVSRANR